MDINLAKENINKLWTSLSTLKNLVLGIEDIEENLKNMESYLKSLEDSISKPNVSSIGRISLNHTNQSVEVNGKNHHLTQVQYKIYAYLFENVNDTKTRLEIMDYVWGRRNFASRTIDVHILRIRKILGSHLCIESIHGEGYKLNSLKKFYN